MRIAMVLAALLLLPAVGASSPPAYNEGYRECERVEPLPGCRVMVRASLAVAGCAGDRCAFAIDAHAFGTSDLPGLLSIDAYAYFTRDMERGGACVGPKSTSEWLGFPCGWVCQSWNVGHSVNCLGRQHKMVDLPVGECVGLWLVSWLSVDGYAMLQGVALHYETCRLAEDAFETWVIPDHGE